MIKKATQAIPQLDGNGRAGALLCRRLMHGLTTLELTAAATDSLQNN